MRRAILLVLVAVILPAAAAPVPKSIRRAHDAELAKLQGTWVLVSREEAGLVTVQDGHTTLVVIGDRWEWKYNGGLIQQGTFKLIDIHTSPKQWEYTVAGGTVGYIKLTGFSDNSASDFAKAIADDVKAGQRKIVLDLRGNPGGFVTAARSIASQ